jgi:ubiquitin carboxyl-terminal hydrolase 8
MNKIEYEYDVHKNYGLLVSKNDYTKKGLSGLMNLGAKCFASSIIQCLSNTLSLTDYFLSTKYKEDIDISSNISKKCPESLVLINYNNLITTMWSENQIIKPKSFMESVALFHKKYFRMAQQDSHEFLLYLLDLLHKSIKYEIEVDIKGNVVTYKDKLMKESIETWKKFYEKDYSFIIDTFNGTTISNISCNGCQNKNAIFEPYNSFSLSLPNKNTTLNECLNNYFDNNEIIEYWKCDKCKTSGCTKDTKIWTIPNYVILHLKRFKEVPVNISNGMTLRSHCLKNTNLVDFPLKDLDLTKYISSDKNDTNNYLYDLYAINQHSGDLNSGHYWASCKNLDDNWYQFNDADVSKYNSSSDCDAHIKQKLVTNEAYILFYRRKMVKR